jgi:hypothetical protein
MHRSLHGHGFHDPVGPGRLFIGGAIRGCRLLPGGRGVVGLRMDAQGAGHHRQPQWDRGPLQLPGPGEHLLRKLHEERFCGYSVHPEHKRRSAGTALLAGEHAGRAEGQGVGERQPAGRTGQLGDPHVLRRPMPATATRRSTSSTISTGPRWIRRSGTPFICRILRYPAW